MSITNEQIRQLWQDPDFPGAFQSALIMQRDLAHEKNIKVPLNKIYNALSQIPTFIQSIRATKNFERRSYSYSNIRGFFKLVESDLALFPKYKNIRYVLFLVDAFSRKIFVRRLKKKTPKAIIKGLKSIFKEVGMKPQTLQSDRGKILTS